MCQDQTAQEVPQAAPIATPARSGTPAPADLLAPKVEPPSGDAPKAGASLKV